VLARNEKPGALSPQGTRTMQPPGWSQPVELDARGHHYGKPAGRAATSCSLVSSRALAAERIAELNASPSIAATAFATAGEPMPRTRTVALALITVAGIRVMWLL